MLCLATAAVSGLLRRQCRHMLLPKGLACRTLAKLPGAARWGGGGTLGYSLQPRTGALGLRGAAPCLTAPPDAPRGPRARCECWRGCTRSALRRPSWAGRSFLSPCRPVMLSAAARRREAASLDAAAPRDTGKQGVGRGASCHVVLVQTVSRILQGVELLLLGG